MEVTSLVQRSLERLIGPDMLELPDFFAEGIRLPLPEEQRERGRHLLERFAEMDWPGMKERMVYLRRLEKNPCGDLNLAKRIVGHDMGNLWVGISLLHSSLTRDSMDSSLKYLDMLAAFRATGLAMAYLGTGNGRFQSRIDASNLPAMINGFFQNPVEIEYGGLEGSISSSSFLAICQSVKNALWHGAPPYTVSLRDYGDISIYQVEDRGRGFLQKDGSPMRGGVLPEAFGDLTTNGTGLGLQLVKRFAELDGGIATIETTTKYGTLWCDSSMQVAEQIDVDRPEGTLVTMYVESP